MNTYVVCADQDPPEPKIPVMKVDDKGYGKIIAKFYDRPIADMFADWLNKQEKKP